VIRETTAAHCESRLGALLITHGGYENAVGVPDVVQGVRESVDGGSLHRSVVLLAFDARAVLGATQLELPIHVDLVQGATLAWQLDVVLHGDVFKIGLAQ